MQRTVAQIPWRSNVTLLDKVTDAQTWETTLVDSLPDDLKGSLPTVEEIEAELSGWENGE